MKANYDSYFVITYIYTKITKRLQKKRTKRKREKLKYNKPNSYS